MIPAKQVAPEGGSGSSANVCCSGTISPRYTKFIHNADGTVTSTKATGYAIESFCCPAGQRYADNDGACCRADQNIVDGHCIPLDIACQMRYNTPVFGWG